MALKPTGAVSVNDYLDQIDEPRRGDVAALHAMISRAVPTLKPSIQFGMIGYGTYHYKYPSGRQGDAPVVALASQKNYISVYICAVEDGQYLAEKLKAKLPKASVGKSCIRFKRVTDIDVTVLEKLVKKGAKLIAGAAARPC